MTKRRDNPDPAEIFLGLARAEDADDPTLAEELVRWADRLAPLEEGLPPALPEGIWLGIEARIGAEETAPGIRTVGPEEGVWETVAPGVERKIVQQDEDGGRLSYFLRLEAGAVVPAHDHPGDEHCVVLEGTLRIGEARFGAGSFQFAAGNHPHPPVTAETAALLFIRGAA